MDYLKASSFKNTDDDDFVRVDEVSLSQDKSIGSVGPSDNAHRDTSLLT